MFPYFAIAGLKVSVYDFALYFAAIFSSLLVIVNMPKDFPLKRIHLAIIIIGVFFFNRVTGEVLHTLLTLSRYNMPFEELIGIIFSSYVIALAMILFAYWLFVNKSSAIFFEVTDYIMPYMGLEHAIEKIGCLAYGCCYGIPSNSPWAQKFKDAIPREPAQVYEMAASFAIFIACVLLYPAAKKYKGLISFMYPLLFGASRFFIELLKPNNPVFFDFISTAHLAMIALTLIGVAGIFYVTLHAQKKSKPLLSAASLLGIFLILAVSLTALGLFILYLHGMYAWRR